MVSSWQAEGVYALPLRSRFRSITSREGVLLRGPAGWGDFCPFADYDAATAVPWLDAAVEAACEGWPEPVRSTVPVNCTIPVLAPERAAELARHSGCGTAKIKVADPTSTLSEDLDRVRAVREAMGSTGRIRVDANGAWPDADVAVTAIWELDRAAQGLEYVEQPCPEVTQLAEVRRRVDVPVAADESIRLASDPFRVVAHAAADIAVLKVAPLGGVRTTLRVAEQIGLPCVVSSAVESSVGLAAGVALAAALPELPYACGLATAALLTSDVTSAPLLPVDGAIEVVRTAPEPDMAHQQQAEPDRAKYWQRRLHDVQRVLR